MNLVVVDASVAAKWLLPAAQETFVDAANRLFAQEIQGGVEFIVPDLFWIEIGNILWKTVRKQRFTSQQAEESLETALAWAFPTFPSSPLLGKALAIGIRYDRSFYDGVYLALAAAENATFVTADERLANSVAAYLPVRWLGAM